MSEINILSVDFDWIMEPSINIYNEIADGKIPLDQVLKLSPGVTLKPDLEKYKTLIIYLGNIVRSLPNRDRVQICQNHDEIIDAINNIWKLTDKEYNIYNIDHHHDCGYAVQTQDDIDKQGLACGNWITHCKNLQSYTWINNKNSDINIIDEVFQNFHKYVYTNDINIINYISFDYVFICLSPGWIPSELQPLFDIIEFNVNNIFKIKEI